MSIPSTGPEIENYMRQLEDSLPPGFPPKMKEVLLYNQSNKLNKKSGRWCTCCDKKFNVEAIDENSSDKVKRAAFNSGVCSQSCILAVAGPEA